MLVSAISSVGAMGAETLSTSTAVSGFTFIALAGWTGWSTAAALATISGGGLCKSSDIVLARSSTCGSCKRFGVESEVAMAAWLLTRSVGIDLFRFG